MPFVIKPARSRRLFASYANHPTEYTRVRSPPIGSFVVAPKEGYNGQQGLYYTRGWTYQEYNLSNRLLVFMDNKVVSRCCEYECQEGLMKPIEGYGLLADPGMRAIPSYPNLWFYSSLVEVYNQRNLGLDSDVIPAFTGILERLNPFFHAGFLQGSSVAAEPIPSYENPVSSSEDLLLANWKLSTNDYGKKRENEKDTASSKGGNAYEEFAARLKEWLDGFDPTESDPPKTYHGSWPCYSHETLKEKFSYPLPIKKSPALLQIAGWRFLRFRTRRAFFYMSEAVNRQDENKPTDCVSVTIRDGNDGLAGILRLNRSEMIDDDDRCELIAISKGRAHLRAISPRYILEEASDLGCLLQIAELRRVSKDHKNLARDPAEHVDMPQYIRNCIGVYERYNVLWVEWREGVAYWKVLGRVFKEMWEDQDLEEVEVTLG